MKTALKAAMTTSIFEVFETMFFLSLESNDQTVIGMNSQNQVDENIACNIKFKGEFSGCFILYIPEKLLFDLTENFMGLDKKDITDEHTFGTIKEAVNMLAGNTFTNFDDTIEFQLNIPEILDSSNESDCKTNADDNEILVTAETTEGHLTLKAIIDNYET